MNSIVFPLNPFFTKLHFGLIVAASVVWIGAETNAAEGESRVNQVQTIAPDVYFHEGDIKGHGHCNNGWVVFEDYVLVIDANFPSGAEEIIPKIRAISNKPIRFAFDTHHHGDHAYGNQVWVDHGATPVAHTGVLEELKKYEPKRWDDSAKNRKDVAMSQLKFPSLLFPDRMIFDDGNHRVELIHFGIAHTHGDGFAWLPKEKILFTGDACVNGPYNYMGDGDSGEWVKTLANARKLGASTICPGHGPMGAASVLEDQMNYFGELRKLVKQRVDNQPSTEQMRSAVDEIKSALQKQERIARYVGDMLSSQVEKVFVEMGGKPFLAKQAALDEHEKHAQAHGTGLREQNQIKTSASQNRSQSN
jgi:cyclase